MENEYTIYVRAMGAYIGPRDHVLIERPEGNVLFPITLTTQQSENAMVIYGDHTVTPAYNIAEYYKHSVFHIRIWVYEGLDAQEIAMYIVLQGGNIDWIPHQDYNSTVEVYIGDSLIEPGETFSPFTEDSTGQTVPALKTLTPIGFDKPVNPNHVDIIIRPKTQWPIALKEVYGNFSGVEPVT